MQKGNIMFYVCPYFRSYRFAEYKKFIKCLHNRLGKGVRKVISSLRFIEYSQKISFNRWKLYQLKIGNLILVVTIFDKMHKEYLGTWTFAKTWKFSMGICLFKINNRNTKTRYEICSKLGIKTPERRQWRRNLVYKSV